MLTFLQTRVAPETQGAHSLTAVQRVGAEGNCQLGPDEYRKSPRVIPLNFVPGVDLKSYLDA
ncbi:MAG: hypothetical protein ACRYFU_24910 [Janthinobacterium lividum]